MKPSLLFFLLTAATACAGETSRAVHQPDPTVATIPYAETKFEKSGYGIKQIVLERTQCFGTCRSLTPSSS